MLIIVQTDPPPAVVINLAVVTPLNVQVGLNIAVLSPGAIQTMTQNALNSAGVDQDVVINF